jgi:class 3 adenylate cyclase
MLEDIKNRVTKTLDLGPQIELSLEPSKRFLYRHVDKKVNLVILIIDIIGSTKLSLTIPTKILARIIQAFSQEVGLLVNQYGGYVLKYVGDSVIVFFPAEFDARKASINAIVAAQQAQNIIENCINPELEKRSYPTIHVKASINYGSDLVVLYGKSRYAHIDLVGPTISIAAKACIGLGNGIIITEHVYNQLDDNSKSLFNLITPSINMVNIKLYRFIQSEQLRSYIDGKIIIYKIVDELEEINKPSVLIKEILDRAIIDGYDEEVYRNIVTALLHFILSKYMISSERKVEVDKYIIDIVIPSVRKLEQEPNNALILSFPDKDFDPERLLKIQPNKDNIWLIFGYDIDLNKYNGYRVYLPDKFNHGRALSLIVDDIKEFLNSKGLKELKILPF